ncbi:Mitochondrial ATP-dependent RNA helicase Suv3 [Rasamsonia emersonii CBS 393.64]|uniref:RNA helicase n=1 Tax=Rasamsonia emersonii (strain ATCC 16479 / CBS 393.64 / IMI 116815) TaxID=1408163 RepID=A0A0F4YHN6_RASE3|nr:Mitochondrial ATP-dependent RNA helicase Suv3 [Rasamsonia emersonii CBS 393.64]KKA17812.1 Mitochondrial ATP-dependent RNA helicase Suv3 [Rasamsonia emersonii CBS 393.64]
MQIWTSKASHCLLCSFRPLFRQATRGFNTTSALARSKSKRKAPKLTAKRFDESDPKLENWDQFERRIVQASKLDDRGKAPRWGSLRQLKSSLQEAYLRGGMIGLRKELQYLFQADEITAKFSTPHIQDQQKVADLRYPAEWYPQARSMQRTIHLHVGPTNSGKTYHALKRLEQSKRGFYAGPLRLLAQEVYTRFNSQGIPCGLVTGDEVRFPDNESPRIISNTVEMVSLAKEYEVGVIDEIQMISDPRRGWAWTRALLGARASELHLCGETRAVPLIRELVALTGDTLEIHRYDRLNPLKVMSRSLRGDLRNLQKGDCLVSFSRLGIHALKNEIEKATGRRAAIVYGSLPAEIRTQQANLFNDPNNDYDFLVASDAIGMGLNLKCKRIIFETLVKRLPTGLQRLSVPEIKQIAGRAGRYRAANETGSDRGSDPSNNVGLVTSLEEVDLPYIQQAMNFEPPPLKAAGIYPPDPVIQHFSNYFPSNVPFQYIVKRLMAISQVHPLFFMCDPTSQLEAAEIIDSVPGLSIEDQLVFMAAPIYAKDPRTKQVCRAFAKCVAEQSGGRLLDIPELNLEILEQPVSGKKEYLHDLECLHKSIILYSWLSYRLGGIFTDRTLAGHVKELVEERMVRALTEFSANRKLRKDASLRRQIALQRQMHEQKRLLAEAGIENPQQEDGMHDPLDLHIDGTSLETNETSLEATTTTTTTTTATTATNEAQAS